MPFAPRKYLGGFLNIDLKGETIGVDYSPSFPGINKLIAEHYGKKKIFLTNYVFGGALSNVPVAPIEITNRSDDGIDYIGFVHYSSDDTAHTLSITVADDNTINTFVV